MVRVFPFTASPSRRPPYPALTLLAALLLGGCATAPAEAPEEDGPDAAAEVAAADAAPASGDAPAETAPKPVTGADILSSAASVPSSSRRVRVQPDPSTDDTAVSGWLDDPDQPGRRYYLARLPKDVIWARNEDGTVRTKMGGITIPLDSEDDEFIYYRVYDVSDIETNLFRQGMTEEEKAAVAETFRFEERTVDRLRLAPFDAGLPKRGQWRNGFAVADMNGDGHLDLVHGAPRKMPGQGPVVFLGDGAGNWRPWDVTLPRMRYDYGDVAVADFDGDGRLDIGFGMHLLGLAVLVQREPGVFSSWGEGLHYQLPGEGGDGGGFSSRAIDVVDWNADGRPDLIALGEGPRLNTGNTVALAGLQSYGAAVYLNQGDGSWRRIDQGSGRDLVFGDDLEVADFDGDGRPDFATSSSAMSHHDLVHLGAEDGDGWLAEDVEQVRDSAYVPSVAAADFDADGAVDLAVSFLAYQGETWRSGLDVLLRRGDGWERRAVWNEEGRDSLAKIDAGDVDGDGVVDLAAVTRDGALRIWLGAGGGDFALEDTSEFAGMPGCQGYHVEVRDLDGDGRGEVLGGFAGEPGSEIIFDPEGTLKHCSHHGGLFALRSEGP